MQFIMNQNYTRPLIIAMMLLFFNSTTQGQVLDKQLMLDRFDFWQNKDWAWYK